jgi:hypothetical protein
MAAMAITPGSNFVIMLFRFLKVLGDLAPAHRGRAAFRALLPMQAE